MDIPHLANPIDTIRRLGFSRGVPPAPIVHHVIGLDQCQTYPRDIGREDDNVEARMVSKPLHDGTARLASTARLTPTTGGPVENVNVQTEFGPITIARSCCISSVRVKMRTFSRCTLMSWRQSSTVWSLGHWASASALVRGS